MKKEWSEVGSKTIIEPRKFVWWKFFMVYPFIVAALPFIILYTLSLKHVEGAPHE